MDAAFITADLKTIESCGARVDARGRIYWTPEARTKCQEFSEAGGMIPVAISPQILPFS